MVERDAEARDVLLEVGWFDTTADDGAVELAPPPAPQQVEQAMLVARGKQRYPFVGPGERHPPVHLEPLRDL